MFSLLSVSFFYLFVLTSHIRVFLNAGYWLYVKVGIKKLTENSVYRVAGDFLYSQPSWLTIPLPPLSCHYNLGLFQGLIRFFRGESSSFLPRAVNLSALILKVNGERGLDNPIIKYINFTLCFQNSTLSTQFPQRRIFSFLHRAVNLDVIKFPWI